MTTTSTIKLTTRGGGVPATRGAGLPAKLAKRDSGDVLAIMLEHRGAHNAITSRAIARQLLLTRRTVRAILQELVLFGYPIGALPGGKRPGYFMMVTEADFQATRAVLRSRLRNIAARDRALAAAWEHATGQYVQPLLPWSEPLNTTKGES